MRRPTRSERGDGEHPVKAEHLTLAWRSDAGDAELAVLLTVMAILFVRGKVIASTAPPDSSATDVPVSLRVPTSVLNRPLVRFATPLMGLVALLVAVVVPVLPFFNSDAHRFELVVTLVMADFSTVQVMSGGQSASVALMMKNQMSLLQYPAAAANAVILLILVLLMVAGILRIVDIRKEL